jgi:MFS family permease
VLRTTLVAVTLVGIFAYNFTVTLALLAKDTFHGDAGTYAALTACMGAGAIAGGLYAAHRAHPTPRFLQMLALAFGVLLAALALSPTALVADIVIVAMGAASVGFIATSNATLQMHATGSMRGRVMSLYAMAFLGTTPIGAPLMGWLAEVTNPRITLLVGAAATLVAAGLLALTGRRAASGGTGTTGADPDKESAGRLAAEALEVDEETEGLAR